MHWFGYKIMELPLTVCGAPLGWDGQRARHHHPRNARAAVVVDLPDVEAEPAVESDRPGVRHGGDRLQLLRSLRRRRGGERPVQGLPAPGSARFVADGDRVDVADAARRGEPEQVTGD